MKTDLLGALVQISKSHADGDEICLTIIQEPVHIRVSLTPQNFADTLCTGRKVEARVVRWRLLKPANEKAHRSALKADVERNQKKQNE